LGRDVEVGRVSVVGRVQFGVGRDLGGERCNGSFGWRRRWFSRARFGELICGGSVTLGVIERVQTIVWIAPRPAGGLLVAERCDGCGIGVEVATALRVGYQL
jgi:hypothetical protein